MCMIGGMTFGRMDRTMADCLVYVALGISLYLYGQVFTEKKEKELKEIAAEGKTFPVECQFCDEKYLFTPEDIETILKGL